VMRSPNGAMSYITDWRAPAPPDGRPSHERPGRLEI
jgi:hypothetical protein